MMKLLKIERRAMIMLPTKLRMYCMTTYNALVVSVVDCASLLLCIVWHVAEMCVCQQERCMQQNEHLLLYYGWMDGMVTPT